MVPSHLFYSFYQWRPTSRDWPHHRISRDAPRTGGLQRQQQGQSQYHQQSLEEQERYHRQWRQEQSLSPSPATIQDKPPDVMSPYPNDSTFQSMNTTDDEETTTLSQGTILKIQKLKRLVYRYAQYYRNPDAIIKCATYWSINGDNMILDEMLDPMISAFLWGLLTRILRWSRTQRNSVPVVDRNVFIILPIVNSMVPVLHDGIKQSCLCPVSRAREFKYLPHRWTNWKSSMKIWVMWAYATYGALSYIRNDCSILQYQNASVTDREAACKQGFFRVQHEYGDFRFLPWSRESVSS